MRIGAVNYLNSKPLIHGLEQLAPDVRLRCDLPSRLADSLAAGRLDVALVPSIECFRTPRYAVVSDACVASGGPVLSVKLHFRLPPPKVKRLALDEGSRTSAALAKVLLAELAGASPECESLLIGSGIDDTDADAVLLIGDRAMVNGELGDASQESANKRPNAKRPIIETWDLGERWTNWTGLPFVFAMWVARPDVDTTEIATRLSAARDLGIAHLDEIAAREAPLLGIGVDLATRYFRDNLRFKLRDRELRGLQRFGQLCDEHGLVAASVNRSLESLYEHGCTIH
jgi:chorismate dehydratase